jgi:hypothetical protein
MPMPVDIPSISEMQVNLRRMWMDVFQVPVGIQDPFLALGETS